MEWEDCSPTHSLWEQSSKRYRTEIWCTESGDVRGNYFCGKVQSILRKCSIQVAHRQSSTLLAKNLFDGSELYRLLDGYHMIEEHQNCDRHHNADSLSKKTEFYERLEEKQANQAEIMDGIFFLDKDTYDQLPLTRWLDKSEHTIRGYPNFLPKSCRNKSVDKG